MDERELRKQVRRIMTDTHLIDEQIENAERLKMTKDHMQKTIQGIIKSAEKLSEMIGFDVKDEDQVNHLKDHTSIEATVRAYTMDDEKLNLANRMTEVATFWKNSEVSKRQYWRGKYHGLRSSYISMFGGDDWLRSIESEVFFIDAD